MVIHKSYNITSLHSTPSEKGREEAFIMCSWKEDKTIAKSRKSQDGGESEGKFPLSLAGSLCW